MIIKHRVEIRSLPIGSFTGLIVEFFLGVVHFVFDYPIRFRKFGDFHRQ